MNEPDYTDVIKAQALGNMAEATALRKQFDGTNDAHNRDLITAVFCIIIEHRFRNDTSRAAIDAFMTQARDDYAQAPEFKTLTAEVLVRATLNEDDEHLISEIDGNDIVPTQIALIRKCVCDSAELTARIDDVMIDAKNMVAAWDAEDSVG